MSDVTDLIFAFVSGFGLLALSVGAFGVLDAYHKRGLGERRVDLLIGLYALGVVANIVAYVMADRWYIAAPLALMLWPAERALDKRGTFKRRTTKVDAITGR
ncbi:hypothetical protein GCM10010170_068380 [Dactylosporangium salmoneum]|uniref:Uncharacterized protein n=1 Tax=Dactylosporangium salmoneum TaxID=53361 RepID=A0ABN3H430_9ACTN